MSLPIKPIGIHILGWALFFSLVIGFIAYSPELVSLSSLAKLPLFIFFFVYLFLYYFNTFVLIPNLYLRKSYFLYFTIVILLLIGVYFLKPFDHLVSTRMNPPGGGSRSFDQPPGANPNNGRHLDIISVVLFLTIWSFSSAVQIFKQWQNTERRALQAEADKVAAELSFLKAQINPHFLFNTLNNIYSLAIIKSEQTPKAILTLSNILRYITDDVRNDFVLLQSEIECAADYIELQKLRLSKKVEVHFSVEGNAGNKKIAPLLFMTFIENAFKYGISNHEDCTITIEITIKEKSIYLFCQNSIMIKSISGEREGVGINNAKKRLEYLYAGKHLLNIHTEEEKFSVHLTITV